MIRAGKQHERHFFPMPNDIFRLDLSAGAIAVYAYLMCCEDRKTYRCYPSYTTIGQTVGLSKNTVRKYVEELRNKRLIETEPTMIHHRNGNLLYKILPIEMAKAYAEQQEERRFLQQIAAERVQRRIQEYDQKHPKQGA